MALRPALLPRLIFKQQPRRSSATVQF